MIEGYLSPENPILRGKGSFREQALRVAETLSAPAKAIVDFAGEQRQKLIDAETLAKTFKGTSAEKHYREKYGEELAGRVMMGVGSIHELKNLAREFANKKYMTPKIRDEEYADILKAQSAYQLPFPPGSTESAQKILGMKTLDKLNDDDKIAFLKYALSGEPVPPKVGKIIKDPSMANFPKNLSGSHGVDLPEIPIGKQPGVGQFASKNWPAKDISMEQKPIISTLDEWNVAAQNLMNAGYKLPEIIKHIGPVTSVPQTGPLKFPAKQHTLDEIFEDMTNTLIKKSVPQSKSELEKLGKVRYEPLGIPASLSSEAGVHKISEALARGAGYNVPVFKGMRREIEGTGFRNPGTEKSYEQGQFFTRSPYVANRYADLPANYQKLGPKELQKYLDPESTQQVLPFWLKMQDPLLAGPRRGSIGYHQLDVDDIIRFARREGHDSTILRNVEDIGGISNQYVVFNPSQIRLPWARFQDTLSPNLLGARVPPTKLLEGYENPE